MRRAATITRASLLGLAIAMLTPAQTAAQSIAGGLAERSQSTIRISVSIAPHFSVKERASDAANLPGYGLELATNVKAVRYTIQPIDQLSGGSPRELQDQTARSGTSPSGRPSSLLLLVVPD